MMPIHFLIIRFKDCFGDDGEDGEDDDVEDNEEGNEANSFSNYAAFIVKQREGAKNIKSKVFDQ